MAGAGPLAGTTVIEWCTMVAGPFAGKWLAEAGADVIKIEPPGGGDPARRMGPFPDDIPHPEKSALFLNLNTNKRSITLDPSTSDGRELLRRLVAEADVLLEDQPTEVARAAGLDAEGARALNPRCVVTSVTPFGRTGPYAEAKAYPLNIVHGSGGTYHQLGGRLSVLEQPDAAPVKPGAYAAECDAGIYAATGTLAALLARRANGRGQHLDLSRQWAMASTQRGTMPRYVLQGVTATRQTDSYFPGVHRCKDGYTVWIISGSGMWDGFARLLGSPAFTTEPWFTSRSALGGTGPMTPERQILTDAVAAYCADRSGEEIQRATQGAGLAVTYYKTAQEVNASEHHRQRGFISDRTHPEAGTLPHQSFPFRASAVAERPQGAAPLLGEHNIEVICDRLGYSRADVVRLRQGGVI